MILVKFWNWFKKLENAIFVFLCIFGFSLVFLIPPFQSPDEQTHFYRSYQISEGRIFAQKISPEEVGGYLPKSLEETYHKYQYIAFKSENKANIHNYANDINKPLNSNHRAFIKFENTAVYPPFSYLPQSFGIFIGRIFNLSPLALLYLARLFTLITWLVAIFLAIKIFNEIKLAILSLAALPIVLFQASSASADMVITSLCLLYVIIVIKIYTSRIILDRKKLAIIFFIGIAIGFCKAPYFLISLLSLIIPLKYFSQAKYSLIAKLVLTLSPLAMGLLWMVMSRHLYINPRQGASNSLQVHWIVSSPFEYLRNLINTYFGLNGDHLWIESVGVLGWLDTKIPIWTSFTSALGLVLSAALLPVGLTKLINKKVRLYLLLVFSAIVLSISTILYMTWNAPKATIIEGIQGRYFVPIYILLIFSISGIFPIQKAATRKVKKFIYILIFISMFITLNTVVNRYYNI